MTVKLLEFTKCLCCIPLKTGLLIWGYTKLIFSVLTIMNFLAMVCLAGVPLNTGLFNITMMVIYTMVLLNDAAFTVVLIVAVHGKNVKLLRIAYVYNMVWICVAILDLCWRLYNVFDLIYEDPNHKYVFLSVCGIRFFILVLHGYVVLLLRSKINLLQNGPEQFDNKMAEQNHRPFYSTVQISSEKTILQLSSDNYKFDI